MELGRVSQHRYWGSEAVSEASLSASISQFGRPLGRRAGEAILNLWMSDVYFMTSSNCEHKLF